MSSILRTLFLTVAVLASPSFGAAGGASTGGGDNKKVDFGTAWFLGDAPVAYCIEEAADFGPSPTTVQDTIQNVLKTWQTYSVQKQLAFADPSVHLDFNFNPLPSCDGTQDLTFYLGVTPADVLKRKQQYENPTAFAYRQSYDMPAGRGKGYIWVAEPKSVFPASSFPDWTKPYTLNGILLHEVGHMMGCDHVEGTIMSADMTWRLTMIDSSVPERGAALLTHIDDEKELKACNNCALDIDGQVGYADENLRAPDVFKMLTGKAPVGTVTAKLQRAASTDPSQVAPLYYVLVDGKGNHPFEVQWTDNLLAPNGDRWVPLLGLGDAKVFAAAKGKGINAWAETDSLTILVRIGLLKATNGTQYSVILTYNLDNLIGPYHLLYLDHGIPRSLFSTKLSLGAPH